MSLDDPKSVQGLPESVLVDCLAQSCWVDIGETGASLGGHGACSP